MEKSFPKTKEYMVPQIYEYILHRSGDKSVQNDKTGIQRMLQNFNGAFTEEQLRENMEKYNLTKMFELVKKYFKREYDYEDDSIILSNNYQQSINSYLYDDQGVFDTLLENEYGLMALALKKATDEDLNTLYDIEDIYEWIDYVRSMGVNQVF